MGLFQNAQGQAVMLTKVDGLGNASIMDDGKPTFPALSRLLFQKTIRSVATRSGRSVAREPLLLQ